MSQEKPQPDPLIGQGIHPFCGLAPPLRGIHRSVKITQYPQNSGVTLFPAGTEKRCPKQHSHKGSNCDSLSSVSLAADIERQSGFVRLENLLCDRLCLLLILVPVDIWPGRGDSARLRIPELFVTEQSAI